MVFQIIKTKQARRFLADVLSRVVGLIGEHRLEVGPYSQTKALKLPQSCMATDTSPAIERCHPMALGTFLHSDVHRGLISISEVLQYTDGLMVPHHLYRADIPLRQ